MFRSRLCVLFATALVVMGLPAVALAATKNLTVTGKVTGSAGQNLSVMLVSNDGTGVKVTPDASGKFTAKVPAAVASGFVVSSSGKGPTLHLLKAGKYAGPVVLGKKNSTTGYTRLSTKKRDRKSTRLNSSHIPLSRMPSSA